MVLTEGPLSCRLPNSLDLDLNEDMPLNNRNFVQLAIGVPGVNGTGHSTPGSLPSGAIGNPAAPVISAIVGNPRLMQLSPRLQF